ncbi:MAG: rhodanese-like domain-containing protein [Myxococcota bacterium]
MTAYDDVAPRDAHARAGELTAIDVREPNEWDGALGRVPGALHVPLGELAARADALPRGRALLLVCRSGRRSAAACETLAARGLGPLHNLEGGMIAWCRAGLPVERRDPSTPAALVDGLVAWLAQVTMQTPDAARARVGDALAPRASTTRDDAARAIDAVEAALAGDGAPADLDLVVASYRRALRALGAG